MTLRSRRHWSRPIPILLLIALLPGCGGLLSSAPERQLYRLDPTFVFAAPLPHAAAQLIVAMPAAPAALATERIALSRSSVTLDYFADAQWPDRVPYLVQTALVDGFEKSTAIPNVGPESLGLRADFTLDTTIDDFEAVYDSPGGPPRVVVKLHVTLMSLPEHKITGRTSVSREANAATNSLPEIISAFDQALGGAVSEVVTWTVSNRLLPDRHASVISRTRFVHASGSDRL
jgi:cholesterol transport system auxiliary component